MNIGEQIRIYRKEHNMTQEQIATTLGVTAPAVNKWERGASLPDITLLPALARLLEIDMNTLFSFHDELTEPEIAHFVNTLYEKATSGEIAAAFTEAQAKIRDYPHCEPLIYTCATMLLAALTLSTLSAEEKSTYAATVKKWFMRVSESDDANYRTAACYQLAVQEIDDDNLEHAETLIEQLPNIPFDKTILQLRLLAKQGNFDEAALQSEAQVLAKIVTLHSHLQQLIEFETKTGHTDEAQAIADIASHFVTSLGLWPHEQTTPQLVAALYRKDTSAALTHIRTILDQLTRPWQGEDSPLFYRLAQAGRLPAPEPAFINAFIREMETQPEYDFLRNEPEFQALLATAEAIE
ncbi:MAG: helix-turn-helix transcriptional regulator [Peptococcaceae bacterium]|nr:helix-turn-helix transcriptional regulator [Peptococcaceae bacterium]